MGYIFGNSVLAEIIALQRVWRATIYIKYKEYGYDKGTVSDEEFGAKSKQ